MIESLSRNILSEKKRYVGDDVRTSPTEVLNKVLC
jgi:hypothetical protein